MDTFRFSMNADIIKSDSEERRLIGGYASTQVSDRQGEELIQKGLDISDFVDYGYFNYDHDNSIILGYPLPTCRVDDIGFWVEGEILKGMPASDKIWELAKALSKSKAPRKIGFSVEGKVLERTGTRITKAKIYNVAITTNPVNTTCTWDILVKSFNGQGGIAKALEAGHTINPEDMQGGEVFVDESLEDDLHKLSYVIDDEEKKKFLRERLSKKKSLTQGELVVYLQLVKGWSQIQAKDFIRKHIVNT